MMYVPPNVMTWKNSGSAPTSIPASVSAPAATAPPVKSATQVTIEEPNIAEAVEEKFKDMSADELRSLLSNRAKLDEMYYCIVMGKRIDFSIGMKPVQEMCGKLKEYTNMLRNKALKSAEKKQELKKNAEAYDKELAEYTKAKEALNEVAAKVSQKKSADSSGLPMLVQEHMKVVDAGAQSVRSEFKKKRESASAPAQTSDVEDFIKKYRTCLNEYYRCDILLNNLPQH